jgi:predicted nucleic acid-binding protein
MLLIDTSVWIDFFNDPESPSAKFIDEYLSASRPACINAIVEMEILQGIRDEKSYVQTKIFLKDFQYYDTVPQSYFDLAIDIYRSCRKKGITIRKSTDCLIAANCIIEGLQIAHRDRDFSAIAKAFPRLTSIAIL